MNPVEPVAEQDVRGIIYTHPRYGAIRVGRIQGAPVLAGVDFQATDAITITVTGAEWRERDGGEMKHSPKGKTLVELYLSPAQWAELVSFSPNFSGTPCTLIAHDGEYLPPLPRPRDNPTVRARRALTNSMKSVLKTANALLERIAVMELPSGKRAFTEFKQGLKNSAEHLLMELTDNAPYLHELHEEQLEKAQTEAATAVAARITTIVQDAGLAHLGGRIVAHLGTDDSDASERGAHGLSSAEEVE